MAERGLFVVLEGVEGSGKSTQSYLLSERYKGLDVPLTVTREPGGTKWGEGMRALLLQRNVDDRIDPLSEVLAFYSSRREFLRHAVAPSIERGIDVLADRFDVSSYVYQGMAQGLGSEIIETLSRMVVAQLGLTPDLVIILDAPAEVGLGRKRLQGGEEITFFEKQMLSFHERVREGYQNFASRSRQGALRMAHRVEMIDAMQTPEVIHEQIVGLIEEVRREKNLGTRSFATA